MTASTTTAYQSPEVGTYSIDPSRSTLVCTVRHLFGLGQVRARFTITSGAVHVAAQISASSAVASVDARSFSSDNPRRDKDVRSAALLDVDAFPEIRFRSTALHEHQDHWCLEGEVTAHGNTVAVPVDIRRVTREGGVMRVIARAERLDRYDFGITRSKGLVGRLLTLDLDIVAAPTSEPT